MKLLKGCLQRQQPCWKLYTYGTHHWTLELSFSTDQPRLFYRVVQNLESEINFALMDLSLPYLQYLYKAMPEVQAIIWPQVLQANILGFLEVPIIAVEEAAIGMDGHLKWERKDIQKFLSHFYKASNEIEARLAYEKWQMARSLRSGIANQLVDIMELYEVEILNYFRYRSILDEFMNTSYDSNV